MLTYSTIIAPSHVSPKIRTAVDFIDPASDGRWDRFVENHPYGCLTHLAAWKNIIEESFGHMKGYYPALIDQNNGEIRAALPVFEVRSWLTGRRMVSIPFATVSDPLVSSGEELAPLIEAVQALAMNQCSSYIEIRTLNAGNHLQDGNAGGQPLFKHHYLQLDRDIEAMKRSFHRSCVRQRINRALNSGLTLRSGESEADLKMLYCLYLMTRRRVGLPPQPYIFFRKIWENLYPGGHISLLLAEHAGKIVAGVLLFKFKKRVSAEVAVMNDGYHTLSPNHLLFWESIVQAAREGYEIFDFGRTSYLNHSLLNFKSRWGTQVSDITYFYYPQENGQTFPVASSRRYELMKSICRYAPDFALSHIGKLCYRHLG